MLSDLFVVCVRCFGGVAVRVPCTGPLSLFAVLLWFTQARFHSLGAIGPPAMITLLLP